jgi:hypothetical protein
VVAGESPLTYRPQLPQKSGSSHLKTNSTSEIEQSASQAAYRSALQRLGAVIMVRANNASPDYATVATNARLREVEIAALLDIVIEARLATRDQYFDRCAALMERVATGMEKQDTPSAIMVPKMNGKH